MNRTRTAHKIFAMTAAIAMVAILVAFVPMAASAQDSVGGNTSGSDIGGNTTNSSGQKTFTLQNPLKVNSIGGLIQSFVEIFSYVAVLLAVLVLIYLGFRYVVYSAQGNASEIAKLHSWLLWTVIGIAIIIGARVMVDIVINTISATGTISPGVIQSARQANQK